MPKNYNKDFHLPGTEYSRRETLKILGTTATAIAACTAFPSGLSAATSASTQTEKPLEAVDFGSASRLAAPDTGTGPYYFDLKRMRRVIHEDRLGLPLRIGVSVTDADCRPQEGILVDLWHCDALGYYSGYDGDPDLPPPRSMSALPVDNSDTFCRGIQSSNAEGIVEFESIYPGWYNARAPHIHVYLHLDNNVFVTSQFLFPQEISTGIYRMETPYNSRPIPHTNNDKDFLTRMSKGTAMFEVSKESDGYLAIVTILIDN